MKCQTSLPVRKNILKCRLLEFVPSMLSINGIYDHLEKIKCLLFNKEIT